MTNWTHYDRRYNTAISAEAKARAESALVTHALAHWRDELADMHKPHALTPSEMAAAFDATEWDTHMDLFRGAVAYIPLAHFSNHPLGKKAADVGVTIYPEPRVIKVTRVRVTHGRRCMKISYEYLVH
jgi:hypothetical protein